MLISLTTNHFTMYIKASCYTPYKQTILKKERHVGILGVERDMFIILLVIMVLWVYANIKTSESMHVKYVQFII